MSVKQHLVTAEELYDTPDVPGKGFELVDGEVIEMSPANLRHGLIATMLSGTLAGFARQHNLGIVTGDNVGYVLRRDPDLVRAPDVSFVARESAPKSDELDRFVEGPPTLAVEIVSPDDRATEVRAKVQQYLEAGTQQVWVLWPRQRSMTVYDAASGVHELGPEANLEGGDMLLGFSVRVGDLFEVG